MFFQSKFLECNQFSTLTTYCRCFVHRGFVSVATQYHALDLQHDFSGLLHDQCFVICDRRASTESPLHSQPQCYLDVSTTMRLVISLAGSPDPNLVVGFQIICCDSGLEVEHAVISPTATPILAANGTTFAHRISGSRAFSSLRPHSFVTASYSIFGAFVSSDDAFCLGLDHAMGTVYIDGLQHAEPSSLNVRVQVCDLIHGVYGPVLTAFVYS